MAQITRRRTGEFLRRLFEILLASPGGLKASDALSQLRASFSLTDFEKGYVPSGGERFEKVVRFATVDCVKAGWLLKQKGTWEITEEGLKAYEDFPEPEAFYKEACRLYADWRTKRDQALATSSKGDAVEAAEDRKALTFEQAEEQAWSEIEAFLQTTDPFEIQELVADLLRGMGYHVSWISPPGKDGGVDIIAYTDPLGARGPRIKVQVKRWQNKTDLDGLKAFLATISKDDIGIFVCLAGFTKDAAQYARAQENRRITLLDTEGLVSLWVEHYAQLDDRARQRLPLSPIYFLSPTD